jgi:hypothetical protein
MPVRILSRSSESPLQPSASRTFLEGNVGDYINTEIEVEVQASFITGGLEQLFFNTDNTILNLTGNWIDYGFAVGDTIVGSLEITTFPSTVKTYNANTVVITAISGNLLTYSGSFETSAPVDLFTDHPYFITFPSANALYSFNFANLHVVKDFTQVEFTYCEILNTLVFSPTLNSLLDGSQTKFSASGLDASVTSPTTMTAFNPKSGSNIVSITIEGDGIDPSTVEGKNTYILKMVHTIGGVYQSPLTLPSWYNGSECLSDTYQFKFSSGLVQITSLLDDVNVQVAGNTGWFNEILNGGLNPYTISGLTYKNSLGALVDSIQLNATTKINFTITGSGFDTTDTKFNFGLVSTPSDRTSYANNGFTDLANLVANTLGIAQVYSHSASPIVATVTGYTAPFGGTIDVTSRHFEVVSSSQIDVEIIVSPDSLVQTYIDSFLTGDKTFGFWVTVCPDNTTTTNTRINLLTTDQFMEVETVVQPIKTDSLAKIYPREKDYYTDPTTASDNKLVTEDDAHAAIRFTQTTSDVISQVTMGVELYVISTGAAIHTLDSTTINTSASPISVDGTQEINSITNRPFITYANGNKNKQITLRRLTSLDVSSNRGYEVIYPFRMRWEWWLANPTLPTAFYTITQPLNNLNNEWFTKLAGNVGLRYFMETIQNGITTKNTINLGLVNYRNDIRFTKFIGVYEDSLYLNSLYVQDETNKYTGRSYELIDNQLNYVVCRLSQGSNTFVSYEYAEVTIEVEDGNGYLSQWKIRTDEDPTANNPLRPISGETRLLADITTDPDFFYLFCNIDPNKLPTNAVNYKITAEWVGNVNEGIGDPPYTIFRERDIAWAEIVQAPVIQEDEFCEPNECPYESLVLADTESTDRFKNDVSVFFKQAIGQLGTVTFYLVDENGNEYEINDGTYGVFWALGNFTYEPLLSAVQIHWRNVLILLGEGCYRIKTSLSRLVGEDLVTYSCCYKLLQYSCDKAEKTVRITSVQNGNFKDLGINFKGINLTGDIRFDATFGREQIEVNNTMYVGVNDIKTLNAQDQRSTFTLTSKLVPHICITHPLFKYHLRGTELFVTVYDRYNHRQDYIEYPVFFENPDEIKYFDYNTNAALVLNFSERIIETRTTTCDGDRPLAPFNGQYLPSCVPCSGGGDATIENSDATYTDTIACGDTLVLPDTTINITDQFGNPLDTITFPVYSTVNIDIDSYIPPCLDATYDLEDSLGNPLSSGSIPSGTNDVIIAPDATVENSDASYSDTVVSGGTLILPDSDVNVNGNLEGTVVSVQTIDIDVTDGVNPVTPTSIGIVGNTVTIEVPSGAAPVGAKLMKTGQTTSYRTGDDGDLEEGRATDFFTLASNNPFGNTDRFTDELGGQTYTDDIVIDWSTYDGSTVLGWRRTTNGVNINWNSAIDGALLVSIGIFTTGWRLPNRNEINSLMIMDSLRGLNYAPFNNNSNDNYWSSTTAHPTTSNAYSIPNSTKIVSGTGKTQLTGYRYIPCRTFTVTGTTLT